MDLMRVRSVAKINIYSPNGRVAYSTDHAQIGRDQSGNAGVRAALAGRITSKLIYRDAFNAFDGRTEEDNLIQTYVPITSTEDQPASGVFEIYIDVNSRVADTQAAQWQIIGVAAVIMALLYLALLLVVRYAERIIDQQRAQIRKHTEAIEALSARMLHQQEDEKKKIAIELHEGVAQTLSAVKMTVETASRQMSAQGPGKASSMEPMVQVVSDAIAEVRGVALNLRPSSLDDLGLAATLKWFCREYMARHPQVQAECDFSVAEDSVPEPLRITIYRVIEETCRAIEEMTGITRIRVNLQAQDGNLVLTIEHDYSEALSPLSDDDSSLDAARERALLSGGTLTVTANAWGGRTVRASWLA